MARGKKAAATLTPEEKLKASTKGNVTDRC